MNAIATGKLKSITVEAVITRADGTVENVGVISEWHADDEAPTAAEPETKNEG